MPPRITQEDVWRFTEGDCHILARALNKRYGYTLATFTWENGDDPYLHAFVIGPDGRPMDVLGVSHDWDEYFAYWCEVADECDRTQPNGYRTYSNWGEISYHPEWAHATWSNWSYLRAHQLAPLIAQGV